MVNLLIIDTQPIMRTGLKWLISANYPDWKVYQATTVEEFNHQFQSVTPDIIVLGMNTKKENPGLGQIIRIRKKFQSSFLIIYGEYLGYRKIRSLFTVGIHGYISRKLGENEFIHCLQKVNSRKKHKSSVVLANLARMPSLAIYAP